MGAARSTLHSFKGTTIVVQFQLAVEWKVRPSFAAHLAMDNPSWLFFHGQGPEIVSI